MIKSMKKKKGFTLVELLAVIVVLAIILAIAIPSVLGVINNSKIGSLKSSARLMISSAKTALASDMTLVVPTEASGHYLKLSATALEMDFSGKSPYGDTWDIDSQGTAVYVRYEGTNITYYVVIGSASKYLNSKESLIDTATITDGPIPNLTATYPTAP